MYDVKYIDGNWHIIDSDERTVFTGNKQQVEDWLDAQEIAAKNSLARPVSTAPSAASGPAAPEPNPGLAPGLRFDTP